MGTARVSFDFDGVLSRPPVQRFARELVDAGVEVWITTMRLASEEALSPGAPPPDYGPTDNSDLFRVAAAIGVPVDRIIFTNLNWKSAALAGRDFVWHLDDCPDTLAEIRANGAGVVGVLYGRAGWKIACRRALGFEA